MTRLLGGTVTLRYANPKTGLSCEIAMPSGLSTAQRMDQALRQLAELDGALIAQHKAMVIERRRKAR